jgi:glycosyltransferase involved in cell wall biosynthesis
MRLSVVISAFNEGAVLLRTVEDLLPSALALGGEILVVDDGSTDGSGESVARRFPTVRVVRQDTRQGVARSKAAGATSARGDVLLFVDGHVKVEPEAVRRLVEDVEAAGDGVAVTPAVAALDVRAWRTDTSTVGHGYEFDLLTLDCRWRRLDELRRVRDAPGDLYESPAFIGCAVAMSRSWYHTLWGFDRRMRTWGVEDLDLSLKCWLMGGRILHDPRALVAHRFRDVFDVYDVPAHDVVVNELLLARKAFTSSVWERWLARRQDRAMLVLPDVPEGVWARAWTLFDRVRDDVDTERTYLHGHRARDEFWYASRFGLTWPTLAGAVAAAHAVVHASPSPSQGPPPPPTVEIQVNQSPGTSDDLVRGLCLHPPARSLVNCRIRLTSASAAPVTIFLSDPSGRLNFPAPGVTSKTVTLPVSQAFVTFQVSGDGPSAALGDAVIEARVGSAAGPVCGRRGMSVVSVSPAQMVLTQGGNYTLVGNSYGVAGGVAVSFDSSGRLLPAGVDCSAPQLTTLRTAIMQESSNFMITTTWDTPTIAWAASAASGTAVTVPASMIQTTTYDPTVAQPVNDGLAGAAPLYSRDAAALTRPLSCPGGAVAHSNDTPSHTAPPTLQQPVTSGGATVGTVTWTHRVGTSRKEHFRTFAVAFNTATNRFCALRQAAWDLDVSTQHAGPQHAAVSADGPATVTPATGVQANNAATRTVTAAAGPATVNFTKP